MKEIHIPKMIRADSVATR